MRSAAEIKHPQHLQVRDQLNRLYRNHPRDVELDIWLYPPEEEADISIEQQVEDLTSALGQHFYLRHINIYHVGAEGTPVNCELALAKIMVSFNSSLFGVDNLSLVLRESESVKVSSDTFLEAQIRAIASNHPKVREVKLACFDPRNSSCAVPLETQIRELSEALGQNCFIQRIEVTVYPNDDDSHCLSLHERGLFLQHSDSILSAFFTRRNSPPDSLLDHTLGDQLSRAGTLRLQQNQELAKRGEYQVFINRVSQSFHASIQHGIRNNFEGVKAFFNNAIRLQQLLLRYQKRLPMEQPQCQDIKKLLVFHQAYSLLTSRQGLLEYLRRELTLTPAEWQCLEENFDLFLQTFSYCDADGNVCLSPDTVLSVGGVDRHARRRFSLDPVLPNAQRACFFEANTPLYVAAQAYNRETVLTLLAQGAHPLAPCGRKRRSVFFALTQFTAASQCDLFIVMTQGKLIPVEHYDYVDRTGFLELRDEMINLFIVDLLERDFFSFQPNANDAFYPLQPVFEKIKEILDDELGKLLDAGMAAESSRPRSIVSLITPIRKTNLKLLAELIKFYERLYQLIACDMGEFSLQVVKLKALELRYPKTSGLIAPQVNALLKVLLTLPKLLDQAHAAVGIPPGLSPDLCWKLDACSSDRDLQEFMGLVYTAFCKLVYDGLTVGDVGVLAFFDPSAFAQAALTDYRCAIDACGERIAESEAARTDCALFRRRLVLLEQQRDQVREYLDHFKVKSDEVLLEEFFQFLEPHFPPSALAVLRQSDAISNFMRSFSSVLGSRFLYIINLLVLPQPFTAQLPLEVVVEYQHFELFVRMLSLGADPFARVGDEVGASPVEKIFLWQDINLRNRFMCEVLKSFLKRPIIEFFDGRNISIALHAAMLDAFVDFRRVFRGLVEDIDLLAAEYTQGSSRDCILDGLKTLVDSIRDYLGLLCVEGDSLPVLLDKTQAEWLRRYASSPHLQRIQLAFDALRKAMIVARREYGDEYCLRPPVNEALVAASHCVGSLFAGSDSAGEEPDAAGSYQPPTLFTQPGVH